MTLYSTSKHAPDVSFRDAVMKGLASDNGLFMPRTFPTLSNTFFKQLPSMSFQDMSFHIAKAFIGDELSDDALRGIIDDVVSFDAPLVELSPTVFALELFHGPTLAFKDFGARFLARVMSYFVAESAQHVLILVATSGDTGSAVAQGFLNVPRVGVVLLYPSRKVSAIQEKQLTTVGGNVVALEVDGTFDDCQRLVKMAFLDAHLSQHALLSSANSINIARLLPQMFYYFRAVSQLQTSLPIAVAVPSGNFGNLTAGLMSKKIGLPISTFIAATNRNDVIPKFLESGAFLARPSVQTISNAMDVGNPSNFARMVELYDSVDAMRQDIFGAAFSDEETKAAIQFIFEHFGYICDPHGAIGWLGLQRFLNTTPAPTIGIFLETAHPAKFLDVVQPLVPTSIDIPSRLQAALDKDKNAIFMPNDFQAFKEFLLTLSKRIA
ncbi:MAG: threonine synthase [[Candidatus Thermochlorobacteriaceae] bacterium GBChlB]|nr:MAG: threonine synthase [[Candidatus Thermochlorobacteriaceae] bacterium GBChlB]